MKYSNWRAFEKHLEGAAAQGHFAGIYLIISKDNFQRKLALDRIAEKLLGAGSGLQKKVMEGNTLTPSKLQEELQGDLFAQKRVLCITEIEQAVKPVQKILENYVASTPPALYLLLSANTLKQDKFYTHLEKQGVILQLEEEKPWAKEQTLIEWVLKETTVQGKKMSPPAAQAFIKHVGTDFALVYQELFKLICYVGQRQEITPADISAICSNSNLETIWQLGEAIFRRDAIHALRISRSLLKESHLLSLLKQIRHLFQTGYQISSILSCGGAPEEVSRLFPYMQGNILQKNIKQAQDYGSERYKRGLQKIDQTELNAKNSATNLELLCDLLVIDLTK